MTTQLKTKTNISDRIMALMSDGRERTVNDIRLRAKCSEDEARTALTYLTKTNRLVSKIDGKFMLTVWRKPRAEAAE